MTTKLSKVFGHQTPSPTHSLLSDSSLSPLPLNIHPDRKKHKEKISMNASYVKEKPEKPLSPDDTPPKKQTPIEKDIPIENDPHIFDLLSVDSGCFIHYGKSDDHTLTSAIVEKLVEKLTREMGMFVCIHKSLLFHSTYPFMDRQ